MLVIVCSCGLLSEGAHLRGLLIEDFFFRSCAVTQLQRPLVTMEWRSP